MSIRIRVIPVLVLVALLSPLACFTLSRESPRLQRFVLSGATPPTTSAGGTVMLGLRRIDVAAYLAVPSIIVRRGQSELVVSEFHRWGESLGDGINRVVAANLTGVPPVQAVDVAPWPVGARHSYIVQLHVARFEGVSDSAAAQGGIHLLATWDIVRPRDGAVLVRGITDDRRGAWRVGDYAGLVNALDAALVRLAGDIGACLSGFRNDSTPPAASCRLTGDAASLPHHARSAPVQSKKLPVFSRGNRSI
jgi:uncharacterized lipoprotein YmbA